MNLFLFGGGTVSDLPLSSLNHRYRGDNYTIAATNTLTDMEGSSDLIQATAGNKPFLTTTDLSFNDKQSFGFDGSDDFVAGSTASDWNFLHDGSGGSLACWFYSEAFTGTVHMLADTCSATANNVGMSLWWNPTDQKITYFVSSGSATNIISVTSANGSVLRNQVNELIVGFEHQAGLTTYRVFNNGRVILSGTNTNLPNSASNAFGALRLGQTVGAGLPFNGKIAELATFDDLITIDNVNDVIKPYSDARYVRSINDPTSFNVNTIFWFNAKEGVIDNEGDIAEDGEGVRTWTNQYGSGTNASQQTSAERPVWSRIQGPNGFECINFTGSPHWLSGSLTGSHNSNWTFWALIRPINNTNRGWFDMSDNTTQTNRCALMFGATNHTWRTANGAISRDAVVSNAGKFGLWKVYTGVTTSSIAREIYINDALAHREATLGTSNAPANYRIGRLFNDIFPTSGSIAELVLINKVASPLELQQMQTYFENEWGGSGSLDD